MTLPPPPILRDDFVDALAPGRVIGSQAGDALRRQGVDRAGIMSVDHGALRVAYFEEPGWGNVALAYGPFALDGGAALAMTVTNGRQGSRSRPRAKWGRQRTPQRDNLTVGWFPEAVPHDPVAVDARAFVVRAADADNAQLLVHLRDGVTPVLDRLPDVPVVFVVVARPDRVEYFAGSIEGVDGLGSLPAVRPLAVADPRQGSWFGALHQAVLGEVAYEVDTRIDSVVVTSSVDEFARPTVALDGRDGFGGDWEPDLGAFVASPRGIGPVEFPARVARVLDADLGLLVVDVVSDADDASLELEVGEREAGARVRWDASGLEVRTAHDGIDERVAWSAGHGLPVGRSTRLQLLHDGVRFAVIVDDERVACDLSAPSATVREVAVACPTPGIRLERLLVFPRAVPLPEDVRLSGWPRPGTRPVIEETFAGPSGELGDPWERVLGVGRIVRTGAGAARIDADRERPCPGRTAYVRPWSVEDFADVEVTITPPGNARGIGHNGRAGIVLWSSPEDHVLVNVWLDDAYPGASISMFACLGGRERPREHDAVWTNVGSAIRHGVPIRLRVVSDGHHVVVSLDDRTVLARRLTDIRADADRISIRAVGLVSNWEWGDDTGSVFERFVVSDRG